MQIRLFAAMLVMGVAAMAQEFRGTILGRITDSSGAVVSGAAVQVVNTDTNITVSTTSNQDGNYQVPFLNSATTKLLSTIPASRGRSGRTFASR
jgi:carboxypeptidase family protein